MVRGRSRARYARGMNTPPADAAAPAAGPRFARLLALLIALTPFAAWFLPIAGGQEDLRGPLDLSAGEVESLEADAQRAGATDAAEAGRRLRENAGVRGSDLYALADFHLREPKVSGIAETPRRVLRTLRGAALGLGGAAALLALLSVVGLKRPLGSLSRGLLLAQGLLVLTGLGLLALGMSQVARERFQADPGVLGAGLWALAGGGVLALLTGLIAGRRGTLGAALGLAVVLLAGGLAGLWFLA